MSKPSNLPFVATLISSALILFFIGVFGFLALSFQKVIDLAMDSLELNVFISDFAKEEQAQQLLKQIEAKPYANRVSYLSKEDALKEFDRLGDDFLDAMDGMNPLPASIVLHLRPEYINQDSISMITKQLLMSSIVQEITFPIKQIEIIERHSGSIKLLAAGLGLLLFFVAVLLIVNVVRLSIYARRFLIRTMQLVGATRGFIKRPFIRVGFLQGLLAGLLADGLLVLLLWAGITYLPDLNLGLIAFSQEMVVLLVLLIFAGAMLGWLSSVIAVNRYLDRRLDQIV